jgi:MoxR-like ATPase
MSQADIFTARKAILQLHFAPSLEQYVVQLIMATRKAVNYSPQLARWIAYGASPRATIALERCARAKAWLAGRDFVTPDDVQGVFHNVVRHRLLLTYEAEAEGISTDAVLDEILRLVPVA